jgi:metallo-beta-lactamase family protein
MVGHAVETAPGLSVTFYGAAHAVTGSMHLVEAAGRRVLLDCGLLRSPGHEYCPCGSHFPFAPDEIDAVVLTHAHMDHCGALPVLVRHGFAGPIYCTAPTRDLLGLVLANSGRIHEEEAFVESVVGRAVQSEAVPRYTRIDARQTVEQCVALEYGQAQTVGPDLGFRLADAGHILGSAMVTLHTGGMGSESSLTFTGDLGRPGSPVLPDAAPVPAADLILSECTNGDRVLEALPEAAAQLENWVRRTVERGGKVLIPAFSLGRTQLLLYYLEEARRSGRVPPVPVFVDSQLAADIAEVHRRYPQYLRPGIAVRSGVSNGAHGPCIRYVRDTEEHHALLTCREPCVILAPSGMCQGGRILGHIKENLDDPRCTIILVSYQAPHTLGHRLLQRGPTIRFHGKKWNRWADIIKLSGFSGHPDRDELQAHLGPLAGANPKVRLVHGDVAAAEELAAALRARGFSDVEVPDRGETVRLGASS